MLLFFIFNFGLHTLSSHPPTMDLQNEPSFPPPMYTSAKATDMPYSYSAAPDLEAQQTLWTTQFPPTYLPRWPDQSQTVVVTVKHTQRPTRSNKYQRKPFSYCVLLGLLVAVIFIVITIAEVTARFRAGIDSHQEPDDINA